MTAVEEERDQRQERLGQWRSKEVSNAQLLCCGQHCDEEF